MSSERRVIGTWGAMALVAGSMLGVGILLTPPVVARALPSSVEFYGIWVLGALVALSGGVAYAELGAMMPRAGGDYVFLRAAYGRLIAAIGGTVMLAGAFAGSIAAMSAAVCQYQLDFLLPALELSATWIGPLHGYQVVAMGIVMAITGVNAAGALISTRLQIALTAVPFVALAMLGGWGLAHGVPPPAPEMPAPAEAESIVDAWLAVYFAYAGWPAIIYVAGEVRDPSKTLPRSILLGTAAIGGLYLLLCAAMVGVLGMGGLAAAGEAGTAMAAALLGEGGAKLLAVLVALALLASVNGTVLGGARVIQAMAEDGAMPNGLAKRWRGRAPARALWLQAAAAVGLLATGGFETVMRLTSAAMMAVGILTVGALFVLRWRTPERERPYRASGWPVVPGLYLVVGAGVLLVWVLG